MELFKESKSSLIVSVFTSIVVLGGGVYYIFYNIIIGIVVLVIGLCLLTLSLFSLFKPLPSGIVQDNCIILKNAICDFDNESIACLAKNKNVIIPIEAIKNYSIIHSRRVAKLHNYFSMNKDKQKPFFDEITINLEKGKIKIYLNSVNGQFLTKYLKKIVSKS